MLKLPALFYAWYAYWFNEDGTISDAAAAEICALGCTGTGTGGGTDSTVPVLTASDGLYTNKVVVSWTKITGATSYEVFRNDKGINDPTDANTVSIATTTGSVWEDTNVSLDVTYYYWVKATVTGVVGNFSNGDAGSVGVETPLTAVTNLKVSQGYFPAQTGGLGYIPIEFDPVSGADAYEIYRSTSGAFAGEQILLNPETLPLTTWRRWQTPSAGPNQGSRVVAYAAPNGHFSIYPDNFWIKKTGKLIFIDQYPGDIKFGPTNLAVSNAVVYYYRVVPKKLGSTLIGTLAGATTGSGYCGSRLAYTGSNATIQVDYPNFTAGVYTINTAGKTKMRIVLRGHGGSGSGGDTAKAGAGGGAGALVAAEFTLAGEVWTIEYSGTLGPATTPHEASGADGLTMALKKDGVEVLKATGGKGGTYLPSVACTPGLGGSGDLHGITPDANNEIILGGPGFPDTVGAGGIGGTLFGVGSAGPQAQGVLGQGSGGNGLEVPGSILRRSPIPDFPPQLVTLAA